MTDVDQDYEAAVADLKPEFGEGDALRPGRLACALQTQTGDPKYPFLCAKDDRYATPAWCAECMRTGWKVKTRG